MLRSSRRVGARFVAFLRADSAGVRAGFLALLISSGGDLVTGVTFATISNTLNLLPGLVVLVPAAIGMRGNVFGGLGSRLGTLIHTGTFRLSARVDTEVGQNMSAAILSSLSTAALLAVLAKLMCEMLIKGPSISIADFMVVSVIGAILSSIVVLVLTVAVAAFCANRDLDLDNVAAPIVTAAGDIVTLPSLFVATYLLGIHLLTPVIAIACVVVGVGAGAVGIGARALPILRRIVIESLPILALAGVVDILAGITIQNRFASFLKYPALLVMVPAFLEDSGSLGAILAARVSTKLHLGTLGDGSWRAAVDDVMLVYLYAIPVFVFLGLTSSVVATVLNKASPGTVEMLAVSLIAGFMATTASVIVGFYAAVATYRFGLDPDNHSIPLVTSSLDLLGALSLILAIVILGLA
ncbi:MAG: Divalent cation transporter [Actinomycetia bacterium]|jgi:mgtE-like transporter|nr:Divalent cation transporter [Actinomycetes bacterium]MDQ1460576.1 mgtE-like transporter [Actinomycetota bacterium]